MLGKVFFFFFFFFFRTDYGNRNHSLSIFSRLRVSDIFLIFSRKQDLIFHPARFVWVEVLQPSQQNGVMLGVVSLPNHTFAGLVF